MKLLRVEDDALDEFQEFIAKNGIPEGLRSDNGEEFTCKHFKRYCIDNKTKQEFTVPETPQQNEMVDKTN